MKPQASIHTKNKKQHVESVKLRIIGTDEDNGEAIRGFLPGRDIQK